MNGSLLIFGGNKDQREQKIVDIVNKEEGKTFEKIKELQDKTDIFIIKIEENEKSIGISETREGIKFLREKPFSYKKKFLIILNSEKLTTQAQNSLLKTLEEPASFALIMLSAKTQNSLLGTIVSRCRLISVKEDKNKEIENESLISYKKIVKMTLGERLDYCLDISKEEKEDVLDILESWVEEGRVEMLKDPKNLKLPQNIKRIIDIRNDLENSNVNVRLSLEALVLSLL
jgi:DNA polymerase III subunit delta'